MAVSVKMSSKNQIVVPKAAREALGLRAGDRLLVTIRDDDVLEMELEPRDLAARLEGILAPGEGGPAGGGEEDPGTAPGDELWEELAGG